MSILFVKVVGWTPDESIFQFSLSSKVRLLNNGSFYTTLFHIVISRNSFKNVFSFFNYQCMGNGHPCCATQRNVDTFDLDQ